MMGMMISIDQTLKLGLVVHPLRSIYATIFKADYLVLLVFWLRYFLNKDSGLNKENN